jgi:hypothetical protein
MVKVSIKKFSRSKVEEPIAEEENNIMIEDTEQEPIITKPKKGRPKKQKQEPITPIEVLHEEPEKEYISEPEPEPEQTEDTFLDDLNNKNFVEEIKPTKQEIKQEQNESKALMAELLKPKKSKPQKIEKIIRDDDSLFDEEATPILGKDKRVIIAKLHQYKNLFKEELKKFKIKPNASEDQLKACLSEMEAIVETSSIDNFMTESILQSIKLIEAGSARTKYNISGTAEMLKQNQQFHNLIKQLYVKYNIFSKVPPEFQLVLLVGTTAMLCKTKNDKKDHIESFLNEKIIV